MQHKKAFELSINFLVVVILSIVIFGFGLKFAYDLSKKATDITKQNQEELDNAIGDLICGDERVCLNKERLVLKRGGSGLFGVTVVNVDITDANFDITVIKAQKCWVKKDGTADSYSGANNECKEVKILNGNNGARININIQSKESSTIGIGAVASKNAEQGTYIFNLDIEKGGSNYWPTQKLYVEIR